jgi:hypothetical protein
MARVGSRVGRGGEGHRSLDVCVRRYSKRNNVETAGWLTRVRLGRVLRCYNDYPRGTAKGNYAR